MSKQSRTTAVESWILPGLLLARRNRGTSTVFLTRRSIRGIIAIIALIALIIFLGGLFLSLLGGSPPRTPIAGFTRQSTPTPTSAVTPTATLTPRSTPAPSPTPRSTSAPPPTPRSTSAPPPTPRSTSVPPPAPTPYPDPKSFSISIQGGFICYTGTVGQTTVTPDENNSDLTLRYLDSTKPEPIGPQNWSVSTIAQPYLGDSCSGSPSPCTLNSDWISLHPTSGQIEYGKSSERIDIQTSIPANMSAGFYCATFQFDPFNTTNYFYALLVVT